MQVFVPAAELAARLQAGEPPLLLDVRWALGDPDGHAHYLAGHLPGAVYVDLDTELAGPASPDQGRHPLPGAQVLQRAARRWGLRLDRPVLAYDDVGGLAAARAWWLLRWAGVQRVQILDGGLAAWRAAGGGLEVGDVEPEPSRIELNPGDLPVTDADGAAAAPESGVLLDARAPARYRGEVEPMDPRAGHIPGAVNLPMAALTDDAGLLLAPDQLWQQVAAVGVEPGVPVVAYCGSGVTAAHTVAVLAELGTTATLYPGSWSQWSADPTRQAQTGSASVMGERGAGRRPRS